MYPTLTVVRSTRSGLSAPRSGSLGRPSKGDERKEQASVYLTSEEKQRALHICSSHAAFFQNIEGPDGKPLCTGIPNLSTLISFFVAPNGFQAMLDHVSYLESQVSNLQARAVLSPPQEPVANTSGQLQSISVT